MHLLRNFFVISFVVILASCGNDPAAMPNPAEVAGTYTLVEKSSSFLVHDKGYAVVPHSFITLSPNGQAVIEGLPDCYVVDPPKQHAFLTGQGTWQIEATDWGYGVTLNIALGGSMPAGIYHASSVLLKGKAAPFELQLGIGDPDSNEWLLFSRERG